MTCRTLAVCFLAAVLTGMAQPKPTLAPADYGKWETLGSSTLSPEGKWLAYEIRRTNGNGENVTSFAWQDGNPATITPSYANPGPQECELRPQGRIHPAAGRQPALPDRGEGSQDRFAAGGGCEAGDGGF